MRATFVADDRVDLVDDHRAHGAEQPASAGARQQHVEALGRRDEHVRGLRTHPRAVARRCVAGPHEHTHVRQARVAFAQLLERRREVLLHVVGQRAQRRDVEHPRRVGQASVGASTQ